MPEKSAPIVGRLFSSDASRFMWAAVTVGTRARKLVGFVTMFMGTQRVAEVTAVVSPGPASRSPGPTCGNG